MNQLTLNNLSTKNNPNCTDLMVLAERELAAFFNAVRELFGPEQAKLSAEDWLHELVAVSGLPASTRQLRMITINVSARLATGVFVYALDANAAEALWKKNEEMVGESF